LVRHAIGLAPDQWGWDWRKKENNWNSVCYGGMVVAALAVAEDHPALAHHWLDSVQVHNPTTLVEYGPDGVYPEGPGYWTYGTVFQALMIDALRSAIDDDLGLAAAPGFVESGGFMAHALGPTGGAHNFADGSEDFNGSKTGGPERSGASRGCRRLPRSGGRGGARRHLRHRPPHAAGRAGAKTP